MRLRLLLAAAFAALTLTLTLAASVGVQQLATERLRERIGLEVAGLAAQVGTLLDVNMMERWNDVQVVAAAAGGGPAERRPWLEALRRSYPAYAWIGFADASGLVTTSTGRLLEGANVAARPWFQGGLKGAFVGDVHEAQLLAKLLPAPTDGAPLRFVDVAAPVRDASGRVVGVLGGHLSWSWATGLAETALKPALERDPRIDVLVLDAAGGVLLGPAGLVGTNLREHLGTGPRADGNGASYTLATWDDGGRYLVGRSRSDGIADYPGLGWTVLVRQPADAAYAPAARLSREIAAGGCALALVFALAGWLVAGRIAAPVLALAAAAARPTDGRALALPPAGGWAEVRALHRALAALTERVAERDRALAAANATLEGEVAGRTRALAESEGFLQDILGTSPNCIKVLDGEGQVTFINQQGLCLLELGGADEIVGRAFCGLFPVETRERIAEALDLARAGRGSELLTACPTAAGRNRWWQIAVAPMRAEAGRARTLVVSTDVTEREERARELGHARDLAELAQARAENASRAKTEFVAMMSHEIRTPLNAIRGFSDLLAADAGLSPAQRRYVEATAAASAALQTIIDDVLDFSRIEAGQLALDPQPFAFGPLVTGALDVVRLAAEAKGIALETEVDPRALRHWRGDEGRLRQVLVNLLGNAVKFTQAGHVALGVACESPRADGAILRIRVSDTGIGIPAGQLERIFAQFTQAEPQIGRRYGGTGLGLSICRRLVELMGGTIRVESRLGQGSAFEFVVDLPYAAAAAEVVDPATRSPAAGGGGPPARLLLVDDLAMNREVAKAVLERAGYRVETASGGEEAVAATAAGGIDLVLMDAQMPGMDGLAATRAIRALPHPAGLTPVVAMSANVLPEQVRLYAAAGMNGFIGKPFKWPDLYAVIAANLPGAARDETAA